MIDGAKAFIKQQNTSNRRFFLIERENGYCIVNYDISAHFSSYTLHKMFPNPELMIFILFIIVLIITVIKNAVQFGKKLKRELEPLFDEIHQIQEKELNVEHKNSEIKEFDDILLALYDMKTALSQSLKKE
ncbi:hypothetical protein GNF51_15170, partial [Clostridium perfringens]|nr:hypothetical protein [Clostridium perfringens]